MKFQTYFRGFIFYTALIRVGLLGAIDPLNINLKMNDNNSLQYTSKK